MSDFAKFLQSLNLNAISSLIQGGTYFLSDSPLDNKNLPDKSGKEDTNPQWFTDPTTPPLIYPQDLFSAGKSEFGYEYQAKGPQAFILFLIKDAVEDKTDLYKRIGLYMPAAIKVNYGANWEEVNLAIERQISAADALVNAESAAAAGELAARLATDAGAKVLDSTVDSGISNAVENRFKRTADPKQALLFKNVNFRSFQFDFELLARTATESESIRKIIKVFKWAMHPGTLQGQSNYYLEYPCKFDIHLFTPSQKYMFNIKSAALQNMTVDYGGSGAASYFMETGAPVDVRLSLEFKELSVLTKSDIAEDY